MDTNNICNLHCHTVHDMEDNDVNIGQNDMVQINQAAHKPYATNTPSQGESFISNIGLELMHKLKENVLTLPPSL